MKCLRCGGPLVEGYLPDAGDMNVPTTSYGWVEGAPEWGAWTGLKMDDRRCFKVATYRCEACGHLESFARERAE